MLRVLAVALIAWLDLNKEASALIIFAIGAVITTEVINTAIEKLLDHIHPEEHDAVRFIKDAMAGAVLVSSLAALSIGIVLVLPELIKRLTP